MSKTNRRVKKLLKGLGVGAALLGAGKALMNRRDKANQMKLSLLKLEELEICCLKRKKTLIGINLCGYRQ